MALSVLPSIWLADFSAKDDFDVFFEQNSAAFAVMNEIDDRMLISRHPFRCRAWCAFCGNATSMGISWHYCGSDGAGSVHPAWTETNTCDRCSLNSRMRAVFDFVVRRSELGPHSRIYLSEAVTPAYSAFNARFPLTVGSEYLGPDHVRGDVAYVEHLGIQVRHEDLTSLSFEDGTFDLVITQDVFEHIPDYSVALANCARVLKPQGTLVFTIPFSYGQYETQVRATVNQDGSVNHLKPPEFHGNPTMPGGSLCFQNFGWSLLDELKNAGFGNSTAHLYWGPWAGHLGSPFFVFSAVT